MFYFTIGLKRSELILANEIETSLLTQQVYNVLRENIITRKYLPGDKLDIHKIAEKFGVSRSPVKDAINQLVHEGLIEILPRKGTYVTKLNFGDFVEVLDARLMIEKWAVQQVIHSISEDKIQEWGRLVHDMDMLLNEAGLFSFEQYVELDMNFHRMLVQWTGNKKVLDIYSSLNTHVSLSRIVHSTSLESTIKRHKDHQLLYEAMKVRNLSELLDLLERHIDSLKKESAVRWNEAMF